MLTDNDNTYGYGFKPLQYLLSEGTRNATLQMAAWASGFCPRIPFYHIWVSSTDFLLLIFVLRKVFDSPIIS
jgi:hypothetical protein